MSAALIVACVILAGCRTAPGSAVPTTSASPSSTGAEPTPTASPTTTATAEPTPSGLIGMFAPDEIAAIVTTDLVVRSAPGTGDDSEIYPGYYTEPMRVYVVDGPAFADGYEWYLVDAVRGQGIGEYPQPGWVAAATKDGEPWLAPDVYTCPTPEAADLLNLERQRALACYGDSALSVEGTLAGCQPTVSYGSALWESQCAVVRLGFDVLATPDPNCFDCFEPTLLVFFNGDIGLAGVAAGAEVRIRGHFDDPAAQWCTDDDGLHNDLKLGVYVCRMSFIGTDAEVIGS